MMDEDVLGADHAIARATNSHGVVIVFKKPYFKALVQRTDALVNLTPQRGAKHGRGADVKAHSLVTTHVMLREADELSPGPIRGFNLRLVTGAIRDGAHQTNCGIRQVPYQPWQ